MHEQLIYLLVATAFSAILYPLWINFVYKYHMGEEIRPDGPKTHLRKRGTPTMGGVVFIFVVTLLTLLFNRSRTQTLFPALVALMAALFGLMEDFGKIYETSGFQVYLRFKLFPKLFSSGFLSKIFNIISTPWKLFKRFWSAFGSSEGVGLKTYQKFLIQSVIGGFVAYWSYFKLGWDYIWFPLLGNVNVGIFYPIIIFILFIVVLNAVAFSDGVDGLVGGLSIFAFIAFWVIAGHLEYNSLAAFSATFVGALLPFLYFNIHPARIFMGNVGSHVLGASLAVLSVVMHREIAMIAVIFVFLVDGTSSPLQQLSYKLTRKRIFRMAPLHHHFELLGWPETKVTIRFWLFGMFFAFVGILIALL